MTVSGDDGDDEVFEHAVRQWCKRIVNMGITSKLLNLIDTKVLNVVLCYLIALPSSDRSCGKIPFGTPCRCKVSVRCGCAYERSSCTSAKREKQSNIWIGKLYFS